ncbi:MAG: tetratricopeptide repeat protein, partial [Spirochaeta sp.]|nr:tetratricopeptide repeat protein [Spirochaeta sp.]
AETAEQFAQKYGPGKGPSAPGFQGGAPGSSEASGGRSGSGRASGASGSGGSGGSVGGQNLSESAKAYYEAVSSFSRDDFTKALEQFKQVAASGGDEEYVLKATFEIGRCLFGLERYDAVIKHYTGLIQKFPRLPDLNEALFYLGRAYQASGDASRAASFFKKILSMDDVDEGLRRKVNKAVRALEGN